MAKILPWHSLRQRDQNVYHDDDLCPLAGEIEPKYRMSGRRGRRPCRTCAKLRAAADHTERLARPKRF